VGLTGCIAATAFLLGAGWASPRTDSGEAVYQQCCAACHDHAGPRIPSRNALQKLSVARILHTLDFGERGLDIDFT
jgi:mono/diheme cytochrome c family protein